jgi:5-methyltetrahydrofolate--homocysteine methyltransferase
MEPFGDLSYKKAVEVFQEQAEYLALTGLTDVFLIETMMDINEALAAVEAVKNIDKNSAIICTMTFNENGVTLMGNKAEDSLKALLDAGVTIAGANCSVGSDKMLNVVKKMRQSDKDAKLIFQPNAGLPKMVGGLTVYNETPEIFAKNIQKYLEYKPSIIGGCCGSTPDHIAKLAELII